MSATRVRFLKNDPPTILPLKLARTSLLLKVMGSALEVFLFYVWTFQIRGVFRKVGLGVDIYTTKLAPLSRKCPKWVLFRHKLIFDSKFQGYSNQIRGLYRKDDQFTHWEAMWDASYVFSNHSWVTRPPLDKKSDHLRPYTPLGGRMDSFFKRDRNHGKSSNS